MPPSLHLSLAGVLLCSSLAVQAVELLPDLWEVTPRNLQVDGQPLPDLDRLLVGLGDLSDAQRAQLLAGPPGRATGRQVEAGVSR